MFTLSVDIPGISLRQLAATALLAAAIPTSLLAADEAEYEFLSSASGAFVPTRIVDSEAMPYKRAEDSTTGWGIKMLFEAPGGGGLRMLDVPPGAEGAKVHYHDFHEWAYNIAGDFTNNESTHPDQVSGPLQRFRAGDFLSRPPYSLHGGEKDRQKFMASQVGAVIMIMEESGVDGGTWCVDPDCRSEDGESLGMKFNPDYKDVTYWSTPRIIDTWEDMPWQAMQEYPGLNIKHLVDDPSHGFRATMWFLEAGAATPDFMKPSYFKEAHQFNFMINGDLKVQAYGAPGEPAETYDLRQHYLMDSAPMSIAGLVDENATEGGAVWLEVTYAKGTTWTEELARIEQATYVSEKSQ